MWVTKQFLVPIDSHVWKNKNTINEVNGDQKRLFTNILQNLFVFNRREKFIQVCKNSRVSKWWKNFQFWGKLSL